MFATSCVKSKSNLYLEMYIYPIKQEFDIIAWWKLNGLKYLILQKVTRDFLDISISIVASNLAFVTSDQFCLNIIVDFIFDILEALIYAQH